MRGFLGIPDLELPAPGSVVTFDQPTGRPKWSPIPWSAPGAIGSTTPSSGAFTTLSATGQITSTLATGTAPFSIASTTVVPNLNVSQLLGSTWAIPGSIGATTPNAGAFTTLSATGTATMADINSSGQVQSTVADGAYNFRLCATSGRMRLRGYADATNQTLLEATNAAESVYITMSFGAAAYRFLAGGVTSFLDTTDSTAISSGAIVCSGGIGVAKRLCLDGATGKTLRITNSVANGAVAVTLGSGPTGSTAGAPQGWMRVDINGTDRYMPFW